MIPGAPWEELAAKVAGDAWTVAMLGLWDAGLWVLRLVLGMIDALVVPDLSADGPGRAVYGVAFWLAGALVTVLLLVQLGVAVLRRDGAALAAALTGAAKFLVVWAGWLAYGTAVVAACGGLTRALLAELLQVDSWAAWDPFAALDAEDVTDATVATVLGLMGLLLWLAALGHLVVMVTRAGALLILAAMTPAAAAGLVGEAGRAWFWKSLRWFHAAALTPVLMVLMLGIGVQLTSGVVTSQTGPAAAVGTALPGVMLILISCVAPLALFRLLAFVDPATPSGSAVHTAWAAGAGLNQLARLTSRGGGSSSPPDITSSGSDGSVSAGEAAATDTTEARLVTAETGLLSAAGPAGALTVGGLEMVESAGTAAARTGTTQTAALDAGSAPDAPTTTASPAPASPAPGAGQPASDLGGAAPPPALMAGDAEPGPDRPGDAVTPVSGPPVGSGHAGGTSPATPPAAKGAAADGAVGRAAAVAARTPIVPV